MPMFMQIPTWVNIYIIKFSNLPIRRLYLLFFYVGPPKEDIFMTTIYCLNFSP